MIRHISFSNVFNTITVITCSEEIFGELTKEISDLSNADPKNVVEEVFNSIRCEVRDEINIPMGNLGGSVFMGIAGNNFSADRPTAEFYIK